MANGDREAAADGVGIDAAMDDLDSFFDEGAPLSPAAIEALAPKPTEQTTIAENGTLTLSQKVSKNWALWNGDCCEVVKGIPDETVGFSVFSPPFSSLYVYSNSECDMGNSKDYNEFFAHFRFLVTELLRVTKPGRLCSVHCMNLPTTKQHHGEIGIQDFRGDIIREFIGDEAADFYRTMTRIEARLRKAEAEHDIERVARLDQILDGMRYELSRFPASNGWIYHSEVCIWKDPVTAMQRTKALGLLHKQIVKDSCMSRQGIPDYVCTFRKPGVNPDPVSGEFDRFIGDPSTFRHVGNLSIDVWQRYASPVWMDINANRTLQYMQAREEDDERHICPLQLDVIERCLELWSNEGDTVLSPFAGIGSEIYSAVRMGRKAIGIELKGSYFQTAIKNAGVADEECKARKLF